jgi:transketolase
MRKSFFESLTKSAKQDESLILLTADLGFGFIEDFIKNCPNQFINVGVSEQAMLGLANGLATTGRKVICYSIAAFSLIRPFEFFRNGAIAHNNAVMVVGVGPGFDYSQDGITHYCLEDLAIMQSQPGIMIKTPFDAQGVKNCVEDFSKNPQPTYLRLPRNVELVEIIDFGISQPIDTDVLIIFTALMSKRAFEIRDSLKKSGLKVIAGSLSEISSESDKEITEHLKHTKKCLVIEDHYEFGGLGSRIGDLILSNNLKTKLYKDGVTSIPKGEIGDFNFMENKLMKSMQNVITTIE